MKPDKHPLGTDASGPQTDTGPGARAAGRLEPDLPTDTDRRVADLVASARRHREAMNLAASLEVLQRAVAVVEYGPPPTSVADLLRVTAETYANLGRPLEGVALCRRLASAAAPGDEPDLLLTLAALYRDGGDYEAARVHAARAAKVIGREPDQERRCRFLNNKAVLDLDLGNLERAARGFEEAEAVATNLGWGLAIASAVHNRGVAIARLGRVHEALELFERSSSQLQGSGHRYALLDALLDRAQLLHEIGLLEEARTTAAACARAHRRSGASGGLEAALWLQCQIEIADGRWSRALEFADQLTEHIERAQLGGTGRSRQVDEVRLLLESMVDERTAAVPLPQPNTLPPATAVELGTRLATRHPQTAQALFSGAAGAPPNGVLGCLHRSVARAYLARIEGRLADVGSEVEEGLRSVEENQLVLSTTELRSLALRQIQRLGQVGAEVELAYGGGPEPAAGLVDRVARMSLLPEPFVSDEEATMLLQLRHVRSELTTEAAGRDANNHYHRAARERGRIERELAGLRRRRPPGPVRVAPGPGDGGTISGFDTVHLVALDRGPVAIIGSDGVWRTVDIGDRDELVHQIRVLHLLLDVSATAPVDRSEIERRSSTMSRSLAPVLHGPLDRPLVVAGDPLAALVPWALLTERPVALAPGGAAGVPGAAQPLPSATGLSVICGPGLEHAGQELRIIARAWTDTTTLDGDGATVAAVVAQLQGSGIVHIAAHGRFRTDNPLFSEIGLADGPLTFYDLLAQNAMPSHVVFACCELGWRSARSPLSAFSVLRSRGCRVMVASTGRVRDASVAPLMDLYYSALSRGVAPVAALAEAQRHLLAADPSVALWICVTDA